MQRDDHFIPLDDGYTESGYIAALPGLHGEVSFTFRPLTHAQRNAINGKIRDKQSGGETDLIAAALAKFVKSWSLGQPITKAQVAQLRPVLLERMFAIVAGYAPSDTKPGDVASGRVDSDLDELEAVLAGSDPLSVREDRDAKN